MRFAIRCHQGEIGMHALSPMNLDHRIGCFHGQSQDCIGRAFPSVGHPEYAAQFLLILCSPNFDDVDSCGGVSWKILSSSTRSSMLLKELSCCCSRIFSMMLLELLIRTAMDEEMVDLSEPGLSSLAISPTQHIVGGICFYFC